MRAGILNRIIILDEPISNQNDTGEVVLGWRPRVQPFARKEPLTEREQAILGAGADFAVDTLWRMRWSPTLAKVTPAWRIRHSVLGVETIYNITSVVDVGDKHDELQMACTSGLNNG